MQITFIGNCQLVSLCFYFQQLLGPDSATWVCYGNEFLPFLHPWSDKCVNKILDNDSGLAKVRTSDVIVYQEVCAAKSSFCNEQTLRALNPTARLLKLPSIQFEAGDVSIKEGLCQREVANRVDIVVSDMFDRFGTKLMLDICHPTTFMFLEIVRDICSKLDLPFFSDEKVVHFLENENYMELPV